MGAYLSSPVTDKESLGGDDDVFEFGVCAMQGWRTDMEDAHMVVLDMSEFDQHHKNRPKTSMFAVFDGHGGKEVAKFAAVHLPLVVIDTPAYSIGDMGAALHQAFLDIDKLIVMDKHKAELKALRGSDDEDAGTGGDGGVTINSAQLPDALLEALGMTGDDGGYVLKLVKSPNGQMRVVGEEEEDDDDNDGNNQDDNEDTTAARDGSNDGAAAIDTLRGGDHSHDDASSLVTNPDDLVSPFAQDREESANGASNQSKRKRPEGDMDIDTIEAGNGKPRELVVEDLSRPSEAEDSSWQGPAAGCTAVCALVSNGTLYVANAGDSRCVLSRGGQAIALTQDHKPMDPEEYARIMKAGGFVADGRVNGSLNLSRALGDLEYKQSKNLPPEEQMVTASPEIKSENLQDNDEFLILACDGIWDVLSNQEAVDFVRQRLLAGKTPQQICEEACDHCLAPDTSGCGKGCDNMSIIVTVFKKWKTSAAST